MSFSWIPLRLVTKSSYSLESRRNAIRRRFSWVFRSVSVRAEVAPTPNMIPADVGEVRRVKSSGILSLSTRDHCLKTGIQPSFARVKVLEQKNLESLYASAASFLQILETSGSLDMILRISVVLESTFCGNVFHRKVGPSICVEIVVAAAVIRSVFVSSVVIPGRTEAMMATTSCETSCLLFPLGADESLEFSIITSVFGSWENDSGLMVKVAARRRTKRSCSHQYMHSWLWGLTTHAYISTHPSLLSKICVLNLLA